MAIVNILGITAGALTTFAYLPQVIQIWKTKHTKDLSLPMYIVVTVGTALWLAYGIILSEAPIYLANFVSLALTLSILTLKIKYG